MIEKVPRLIHSTSRFEYNRDGQTYIRGDRSLSLSFEGSEGSQVIIPSANLPVPSIVWNGDASLTTAQAKTGSSCLQLNTSENTTPNANFVKLAGIENFWLWPTFSLEFALRYPKYGNGTTLFACKNAGIAPTGTEKINLLGCSNYAGFYVFHNTNRLDFIPKATAINTWHAVRLVKYTASLYKIYLNDILKGEGLQSDTIPTTDTIDLYFGALNAQPCWIDDFKISERTNL